MKKKVLISILFLMVMFTTLFANVTYAAVDNSIPYFTVSDLEELKDYIEGDGSAQINKPNISFNKSGYDNDATVLIAEKNKLSENSYKSILSVLEVMFNSPLAPEYFRQNYPNSFTTDKEFKGIKIEINPTKTDFEARIVDDSSYKFARITINREVVEDEMKDVKPADSPTPTQGKTPTATPTQPKNPTATPTQPKTTTTTPTPTQSKNPTPTKAPGTTPGTTPAPEGATPTPTKGETKIPKAGQDDTFLIATTLLIGVAVFWGIKSVRVKDKK